MIRMAGPAMFAVARAEHLPIRNGSIDLISAAGSLNYVDLARFFPEAQRVLVSGGVLLVYDFSPGREFPGDDSLDAWYAEFERRYPPPVGSARPLDPEALRDLAAPSFRVVHSERFAYPLELTPEFYLEYVLTETAVSHAVRHGTSPDSIRLWCLSSLRNVFARTREVLFRGYFVILRPV
jgi:SAM-dependent methyltransferase